MLPNSLRLRNRRRARPLAWAPGFRSRGFVFTIQVILILVRTSLYTRRAGSFFWNSPDSPRLGGALPIAVAILSVSFIAASLAAHQYFNPLVRLAYTAAAVWLGLVNFFLLAAVASWIIYGVPLLFGVHLEKRLIAAACFGLGLLIGIYAIVNAAQTRVVRISVKLPNLPDTWRGRTAAVVSDCSTLGTCDTAASLGVSSADFRN